MSDAARKRKKRIRTRQFSGGAKSDFDSPYKRNVNPITDQHYVTSFDDTFEELYKKTQTSVSRVMLQKLFPTQVSNKLNPLLNNIQFSGMVDDPEYLNTFIIQMHHDNYRRLFQIIWYRVGR